MGHVDHPGQVGGGKAILCTCEDITADDVAYAIEEGFDHAELVKRYLTVSMGPCQGKMCSRVAGELCAAATGRTLAATGATTARPPDTVADIIRIEYVRAELCHSLEVIKLNELLRDCRGNA